VELTVAQEPIDDRRCSVGLARAPKIFDTSIPLLHSRTIVDPKFGGKLTGKIGRTTFGMLVADDEAPGRVDDPAEPAFGHSAQVAIGRVRYDL